MGRPKQQWHKIRTVIPVFLIILGSGISPVVAQDLNKTIKISYCEFYTTHRFAVATVREAYRRIGKKVEFQALPCRRSLLEANSGIFDAEVARIAGTDKKYSNLIPTKNPTVTIEGVVATKSITRVIQQWSDLKGLRIGIIRGELYAEKGTAGMNPSLVNSYDQLFRMLDRDHIDVGVGIRRDLEVKLQRHDMDGTGIHITGEPLFNAPLYHLVHKRNRHLLEKLNPVFKDMWENGDAKAIHTQTQIELTANN